LLATKEIVEIDAEQKESCARSRHKEELLSMIVVVVDVVVAPQETGFYNWLVNSCPTRFIYVLFLLQPRENIKQREREYQS